MKQEIEIMNLWHEKENAVVSYCYIFNWRLLGVVRLMLKIKKFCNGI